MEGTGTHFLLRMFVVITDKPIEAKVSKILDEFHVAIRYQLRGKGTANSEFLDICGLSETARVLTVGFIKREMVYPIFQSLENRLKIKEKGRGIAFTVPVNGMQSYLMKKLEGRHGSVPEENAERNVSDMKEELSYAMILVACNQGYSGEVMDAARGAGATGGTIMKSRRQGMEDPMKFLGVSIQEEQEVICIVVPKTIKRDVMEAVSVCCGCRTMAKGIVLSLPVDEIIGLA